jgi:hypothetical protein
METYQSTLDDCQDGIIEHICWELKEDKDFSVKEYLESMDIQDTIFEVIDGCISVYDDDIIDIFKSHTPLKYMDDELGGDTIISKMSGVIFQSLQDDLYSWICGSEDELLEIETNYRKETV